MCWMPMYIQPGDFHPSTFWCWHDVNQKYKLIGFDMRTTGLNRQMFVLICQCKCRSATYKHPDIQISPNKGICLYNLFVSICWVQIPGLWIFQGDISWIYPPIMLASYHPGLSGDAPFDRVSTTNEFANTFHGSLASLNQWRGGMKMFDFTLDDQLEGRDIKQGVGTKHMCTLYKSYIHKK